MSGLSLIRQECRTPSEAVRWCCILEATAPKAGNVYPGKDFPNLSYRNFVHAAEIAAGAFDLLRSGFTRAVLHAANGIANEIGTNVNLGILLLLGPLAETDLHSQGRPMIAQWQSDVSRLLGRCTAVDCRHVYEAIRVSQPGGMGDVSQRSVFEDPPDDLIEAMRQASSRDLIARNYADGFETLFAGVVPIVRESMSRNGDVFAGIVDAHLRLLAKYPDSLICRKHGQELADDVQRRAEQAIGNDGGLTKLDRFLRERSLNPGTTADLIAAALYVLLREHSPPTTTRSL